MLAVHKIVLRYKTLDECFQSEKKWTLSALIVHCSNVLKEKISKRSIQADIQFLRDNNAPIIVTEKKYYTYSDKNFSLLKSEIPAKLEQQFLECVDFIKEMQIFPKYQKFATTLNAKAIEKNESIHYVKSFVGKLQKNGLAISETFYTDSELRKIEKQLKSIDKKIALHKNDKLLKILINTRLKNLLKKINNRMVLVDVEWNETQQPYEFQQHLELPMQERKIPQNLTLWGYPATENFEKTDKKSLFAQTFAVQIFLRNTDAKTGALQVVKGSHKRELSPLEISLITNNTTPTFCNVQKGGIVAYNPMLIKQITPSESPKTKPSITLWFSSYELPVHYVWNAQIKI